MGYKWFIIGLICCLFIHVKAQQKPVNSVAEERVTVTVPSASVQDWFKLIENKGIVLSYNSALINLSQKRTVFLRELTVEDLLRQVLADYKFKIIPFDQRKLILDIYGKREYLVSGILKEKDSGEKLYGAVITARGTDGKVRYTTTDDNGSFVLSLLPGTYSLEFRHMGHAPFVREIGIEKNLSMNVSLDPVTFELKEVMVKPRKSLSELNEATPSNMLSFNSTDLFSQINILPGVIGTAASGNFQVNGGADDENLILLDGVPVYHLNHFNSKLSAFNGDAIKSVTFHNSFFPTEYEGRLSSVTDIRFKEGNKQKFSETLTLDVPAASAEFEGPIIKNKLSYSLGGRRSWLDLFDGLSPEDDKLNHYFYDLNGKLSYDINDHSSLHLTAYKTAEDYLSLDENDKRHTFINWDNEVLALQYNSLIGKRITHSTTLSYSSYDNKVYAPGVDIDSSKYIHCGIREFSFATDFSFHIYNVYTISTGIRASRDIYKLFFFNDTIGADTRNIPVTQFSYYYDNKVRITDKLFSQFGINFVAYIPNNSRNYYSLQPRFSLKYFFDDNDLIYFGASKMQQFYHYLRIDELPLPTDFRMPSLSGFPPSISEHYEAGWKHILKNGFIESSVFYKHRDNIMSLKPDTYPLDSEWKDYIMSGKGHSYGVKFFFYNDWRKVTLQFSYTFSRSKEHYAELAPRGDVPSLYDIPHASRLAFSYKFTPRSAFSIGAMAQSGRMKEVDDDYQILLGDAFRSQRRKMNYRLDASFNHVKSFHNSDRKLLYRVGLYNIVGNPPEGDVVRMYSFDFSNHCLPYASISFKF